MAELKPFTQVRGEFCIETLPQPCGMIIFGASGDLTSRKLIPSLFNLFQRKRLSKHFYFLGCARSELSDESFRAKNRLSLQEINPTAPVAQIDDFLALGHYSFGDYGDEKFYARLAERLAGLDADHRSGGNHLFYLSVPPSLYTTISWQLGKAGLLRETDDPAQSPWQRVILEKPLGQDLTSALALDSHLHAVLRERQIYRIDHYLGKETVQNILMFRFANSIFEPIWNRRYIDHVQITVAEQLGVEHRAGYFDQAGTLRDIFQNHMLQMLSLVAMEPPASFDANRVRDEKVKLLRSIRPFPADALDQWIVRGQYEPGKIGAESVPGYRQEEGVAAASLTETYVAARLMVDNWRWQGVPFYLRTGKRLAKRLSEIAIAFKPVPHSMFSPITAADLSPNVLILTVQPDEGISLIMQAKQPGPKLCMGALTMDFKYSEVFEGAPPEAYERLLLDCMHGDQTLFVRQDDIEVSWSLLTPLLDAWAKQGEGGKLYPYAAGSWGPPEADRLLESEGRQWRKP